MKNCPECGLDLPDEVLYCLYCGTRTSVSKSVKLNRKLFFLFPFFIILVSLAVTYDLGSLNFFESGLLISSALICLYFLGAFSLGIIKFFFKTSLDESSFFISAIFSLINAVASLFAVYSLANLFYSDYLDRLGPTALLKTFLLGIFAFYLIIEIIEILAIVLKSKYKEKTLINNTKGKAILANLWLWIPILYIILTITCYFNILEPSRIAFISRMLIFISSKERAAKYIDDGLKKYNNDAKLCYLKSVLLNESERLPSTQDIESEQEALKFAKIASQEKPDSPFYKYNLSIQYEINRNSEKAIAVAKEAAELAKEDAFLWQFLGDINNRHSNYSQSISAYKKSLEIDSNNAEVLNNLSYTLLIENKDVVAALELAKKSVKLSPNSIANRDTLAWAYYKNNQFTNALETINLLYENRKEISPELDYHYAAILDSMDLLSQPLEIYDKLLVKPEVATNMKLVQQILETRQKSEEKMIEKAKGKK